jgi:NAD(P)-dependent dehydrogenase (short-subunit alcohol dehydrogenase family)
MNISVNLLINNAGIAVTKFGRTKDGFELNFGTNYVAHYYLTELLLKQSTDHLDPDSVFGTRILNITSASFYGVSKIEEQNFYSKAFYERFSPYARSKYAQVLYTMELSRKLLPLAPKTTINACEPGMTKTDIYRYDTNAQIFFKGLISTFFPFLLWKPEEGAISAIWAALSPDVHQVTGKVFGDLHEIPMGTSVLEESDTHLGYLSALSHRLVLEKLPEPF